MRKVLIASRGEFSVRISRACRDAGLSSVAVYAENDLEAMHVCAADEALAIGGDTAVTSYLNVAKILRAAHASGADAIHPGDSRLAANADFAQAVVDAGLTWIGAPPAVIRRLRDRTVVRRLASRLGAPLAAGSLRPLAGPDEAEGFARAYGLPVVLKPAFRGGQGVRGLRVVRAIEEIPEAYDAVSAAAELLGDGGCLAERYVDRARQVGVQCLADGHGTVVVVSTRDATVQYRGRKLVEEAPAPFLTRVQNEQLTAAAKGVVAEAGLVGAATVEFLIGADGTMSLLGVDTRLPAEHPVSEEVSGIDLVCEQLRIADGQALGYGDPDIRGHSLEFRVTAEDPGRAFAPSPGVVRVFLPPHGPGVRLDTGVRPGSVVAAGWDPLLAKLVITGASRSQALHRAARALAEAGVDGVATTLPFHRALVAEPAFTEEPMRTHVRWVEDEFVNTIPPSPVTEVPDDAADRETVVVEVNGKRIEVSLPAALAAGSARTAMAAKARRRPIRTGR